jgi:hypothetical protein
MAIPNAENSLETTQAYDTYSYWRLSSNSSGGAVVYYSGDTLRNTVGDKITPMETKAYSQLGTEQFGLALVPTEGNAQLDDDPGRPFPANHPSNWAVQQERIYPLQVRSDYAGGTGTISDATASSNAQFTFKEGSKAVPVILASNASGDSGVTNGGGVISCATAKVRYVGNIAADTPAGVYTTKINYLAAPQY